MKPDISIKLSELDNLTALHYKIILYLDGIKESTQTQMGKAFGTRNQYVNKLCKELESMDIIRIKRIEGRNIYWALNPNPNLQIEGQVKMEGINNL